jgi:hypothetical protein
MVGAVIVVVVMLILIGGLTIALWKYGSQPPEIKQKQTKS